MKTHWQKLVKVWLVATIVLLAQLAVAAPTLPGDMIADLKSMERQLQSGEYAKVRHHGRAQAQRLEGGNASDRWARALYLQLAASAEARLDNAAAAAELLAKARGIRDMEPAQVDRWQYQEARLRLKANQTQQARDLLSNWLERHAGSATDRWLMAQLLSEDGQWSAAASWVAAALELETTPDEQHSVFAATVLQRAGDKGGAFAIIDKRLKQAGNDATEWRRAAGLAQQLGDTGRAAAIWEAGWQRGALAGSDDLVQRIRLHLAGGTPARAAELLAQSLSDGALKDSFEHRRMLASAWQAARDHDHALAAWQSLARQSEQADDWLRLGQLAHGWGRWVLARQALKRAHTLGAGEANDWLRNLPPKDSSREDSF
ncbi:MAG: tetratricopeptide repeat protein [Marinobacter sp.]|uniref:tetratricopeptide repeat protein n=1 Tax=Marinobacter sp. TaxID=50741 RepID=UPI00264863DB|nr:hypothetical protein [Halomonas sp.]MDN6315578.1 hypothetical protein [Halomonas sp.]MDN6336976.1 hypothetical protein [Halomonas sp.]